MAKNPKFKFSASNEQKLKREIQKQIDKKIAPHSKVVAMLNGMVPEYAGQPVEGIKPVIQKRFAELTGGGSITDPELTEYAEEISRGGSFN